MAQVKRKPAAKKPSPKKPATKKPAPKKPATKKPAPKKLADAKLVAQKTDTKKSTPKKPASKKPVAKKPVAKKPVAKKPVDKKPAAQKAEPKKTATKKSATKKPATKKPVPPKNTPQKTPSKKSATNPFDKKFLTAQANLLRTEREKYLFSFESLETEAQQLLETREQGDVQFDEESGQGDSWAVERDKDLLLSAEARSTIEKIDAALERIKKGTYGICEKSGLPIPKARLQAIPWATERVEIKAAGIRGLH